MQSPPPGVDRHSAQAGSSPAKERIPCLDGLRAISILLVLFAHSALSIQLPDKWEALVQRTVFPYGVVGVDVFFVISGYLITLLLLSERRRTGGINVVHFYRRRILRIFPAFYTYILVICTLCFLGVLAVRPFHLLSAATFTGNFYSDTNGPHDDWNVGHFWTLAYEEQFYLFWPAILLLLGPGRAFFFPLAWVLVAPIVRAILFAIRPSLAQEFPELYLSCDYLMMGSLAALWQSQELPWTKPLHVHGNVPIIGGIFLLLGAPGIWHVGLFNHAADIYLISFQPEINALFIIIVLLWLVAHATSWAGRLLEHPLVVHIGVMSYSIYVWQQLFLGEGHRASFIWLPLKLGVALLAAEISFRFIEAPFRRRKTVVQLPREAPQLA